MNIQAPMTFMRTGIDGSKATYQETVEDFLIQKKRGEHETPNKLWAIAYEKYSYKLGRWTADIMYCHGVDETDARVQFFTGNNINFGIKIVAIGPVIGYHVHDDNGDLRSA